MTGPSSAPPVSHRVLRWALVVAWAGAFVATHVPGRSIPQVHVGDKMLHVAGYFVLASLLVGLLATRGMPRRRRVAVVLAAFAVYGAFDEITQPLFGRSADTIDWLADMLGAAVAVAVWELSFAIVRRR